MIPTLYPIFQHWSKTGSVYIISDTHFGDPDREYMGYNITEEEQINILKKKVHKTDTLIHLGDVGDPKYFENFPCYKVLIMGNHDQSKTKFEKKCNLIDLYNLTDEEILLKERKKEIDYWCYDFHAPFKRGYKTNNLFNEIFSGPVWISDKLVLSHEPLDLRCGFDTPIAFNIHGHDHSNWFDNGHHLNLCAEHIDYTPVSLLKLIKDGTFSKVDSIHRMTIDRATEKKLKKL
jgi:calcineurin-like phosphoesterase family protein